ncbi:hypothetical protein CI610_00101 [invertebrate metagenome]|uniref:MEMO1 family protein n=1 Tax=invertebrate metagenome TaxID=1711999 RepID=A0A2H9TCN2_9ZZZZ
MKTRQPAVAGTFYPKSADKLQTMISDFLSDTEKTSIVPKALIVPHAGYIYSGAIAASAYCLLEPLKQTIRRVVLLGPSHHVSFKGLALPDCNNFSTPLGNIPLDTDTMNELLSSSLVHILDQAHQMEHSLEVQCPFLHICLQNFQLIPLLTGDCAPMSVADIIDSLWGGDETLIIISTDLSHYHNYEEARQRDEQTVRAIQQLSPSLTSGQACGCTPLNGMLTETLHRGMRVTPLDIRNSGDTAGDKKRVVGYGAFSIH